MTLSAFSFASCGLKYKYMWTFGSENLILHQIFYIMWFFQKTLILYFLTLGKFGDIPYYYCSIIYHSAQNLKYKYY